MGWVQRQSTCSPQAGHHNSSAMHRDCVMILFAARVEEKSNCTMQLPWTSLAWQDIKASLTTIPTHSIPLIWRAVGNRKPCFPNPTSYIRQYYSHCATFLSLSLPLMFCSGWNSPKWLALIHRYRRELQLSTEWKYMDWSWVGRRLFCLKRELVSMSLLIITEVESESVEEQYQVWFVYSQNWCLISAVLETWTQSTGLTPARREIDRWTVVGWG